MLALWSCGRRAGVVQAQRQIHRAFAGSSAAAYALRQRVMLIRLVDWPRRGKSAGTNQMRQEGSALGSILAIQVACCQAFISVSSLGFVVARLSGLWLALASLALFEPIAVAVQFEDVDVVGQSVEQRTGQPLRPEHAGPLVEWQIAGDDGGAALIALAEDLEQELGAGRRKGYIAEFIDDQQLVTGQLALQAEQSLL